jgi:hypothetical protein
MVAPLFYARGKKAGRLVRLVRWWMRDELAIHEWEARAGQRWLRGGTVKKGGQNGTPRSTRPPPPKP